MSALVCLMPSTRKDPAQSGLPFDGVRSMHVRVSGYSQTMYTLLWIIAALLVISGVLGIVRGQLVWGIVLIVLGLAVGPGGVSILG